MTKKAYGYFEVVVMDMAERATFSNSNALKLVKDAIYAHKAYTEAMRVTSNKRKDYITVKKDLKALYMAVKTMKKEL